MQTTRKWTAEEIAKLKHMAQKYPASQIAAELDRGLSAVSMKAHELGLSLQMPRPSGPS